MKRQSCVAMIARNKQLEQKAELVRESTNRDFSACKVMPFIQQAFHFVLKDEFYLKWQINSGNRTEGDDSTGQDEIQVTGQLKVDKKREAQTVCMDFGYLVSAIDLPVPRASDLVGLNTE